MKSLKRIDKLVARLKATAAVVDNTGTYDYSIGSVEGSIGMSEVEKETEVYCNNLITNFEKAMSDDLNTPRATAELFALINYSEKLYTSPTTSTTSTTTAPPSSPTATQCHLLLSTIQKMDRVFGLFYSVPVDYFSNIPLATSTGTGTGTDLTIPNDVITLAEERIVAKANKQYKESDVLRDRISELGYIIKDKKDGYDLVRK